MQEFWGVVKEKLGKLREKWAGLSLNQKVLIVGALVLVISALVISSKTLVKDDYVPLYTELELDDAAAMTAKLDELGTPYQLSNSGHDILVLSEQKDKTRLDMAAANLPEGEAGFGILTTQSFGETESDKRVKFQIALQGELTKTIESMDKVKSARVTLAIPEDSLFTEEEKSPTASVLIETKPGMQLSQNEVQAIVHLLASGVEGMTPENVTVVDTDGNLLSSQLTQKEQVTNMADLTQTQLAMKRQYEKEIQTSVQSMMDKIAGEGKSVVRASVELDFDQLESNKEVYGPNSFVRSEKLTEETSTEAQDSAQGVPGTDTNVPSYQTTDNSKGTTSTEKSEKIRNYEIDMEQTHLLSAQGDVKRLTISVVVDKELDSQQQKEIEQAVASACGFNSDRGDTISVAGIKFTQNAEKTESSGIMKYLWIILALVLIIIVIVVLVARSRRKEAQIDTEGFDSLVGDEIKIEDLLERELTPQEKEKKKMREEIEKLVDNQPHDAAQVVRTWLSEDGR
ncbi:MAG: flagellar basal-body MS-ring/collar protein FliF [Chitinophagales bacterium]